MGPLLSVHTREETYLVSFLADGVNAKARGGELDVKVLQSARDGFQQWDVYLKAEFPVSATLIRGELSPLLGIDPPRLELATYSLDQLVARVVEPRRPQLAAVDLRKHRHQHQIGDCTAEFTSVTIDGIETSTVAVESANLDALREVCGVLGLEGRKNVSYPQAIRAVVSDRIRAGANIEGD